MKPRMKGWNPDRDKKRSKSEKLFVVLVLEICDASRLISFLNFYTRVSMEHSRMERIHTLFAAKYSIKSGSPFEFLMNSYYLLHPSSAL